MADAVAQPIFFYDFYSPYSYLAAERVNSVMPVVPEWRPISFGHILKQSGRSEPSTMFAGESPTLISAIANSVISRDVRRTYLLRGSDVPAPKIPVHNSFGGEGTEYQQHLLPTISLVTGPWTLYNPAFGMEAIDGELMRKQSLVFADLIGGLAGTSKEELAGGYTVYRGLRSGICASGLATMGLTRCDGDPYG